MPADILLILSRVCADFRVPSGTVLVRVTPATCLTFQEAPEAIRENPPFRMLLDDGSIEVASSVVRKKNLEADAMKEADASANGSQAAEQRRRQALKQKNN